VLILSAMHQLGTTTGIVALAAAGVALVALVIAITLAIRLRSVRRAQTAVLGEYGTTDLVTHGVELEADFRVLQAAMDELTAGLHQRMEAVEQRLDGTIAYRAVVRYDAYGEMSGQQSASIALLDASRSGVVLSSILHREQARVYAKQVRNGQGELQLSPEEEEAVRVALAGGQQSPAVS
jgi:hypothetical protein